MLKKLETSKTVEDINPGLMELKLTNVFLVWKDSTLIMMLMTVLLEKDVLVMILLVLYPLVKTIKNSLLTNS